MSNRLKKKRTSARRPSRRSRLVEVVTYAGRFRGLPRGRKGWMILESFEVDPSVPPDWVLQSSSCPESGEVFIRPFDGRFRGLGDQELQARIAALEARIRKLGGEAPSRRARPLWLHAEFLQNLVDFEEHPPCGCPPEAA